MKEEMYIQVEPLYCDRCNSSLSIFSSENLKTTYNLIAYSISLNIPSHHDGAQLRKLKEMGFDAHNLRLKLCYPCHLKSLIGDKS